MRVITGTQKAAGALKVLWNQRRTDGAAALPGTYRLVLSASSGATVAYPPATSNYQYEMELVLVVGRRHPWAEDRVM